MSHKNKETSMIKKNGSAATRRQVKDITNKVLAKVADLTPTQAAPVLGVSVDDMRNMRQGNKVSSLIFCKLITRGRFSPKSLIEGKTLRKMPKGTNTRACRPGPVFSRARRLSWTMPGKELAQATGLSVTGAYGLRYAEGMVTLSTLLGLLNVSSPEYLFFGKV